MPNFSKPLTLGRATDLILGSFGFVPSSETINHLVRYLGTWSGSDKFFMVLQYTIKILAPLHHLRARIQYRAGLRMYPTSRTAENFAKLGAIIGDSRMLWRIWGILPIIQWLTSLERSPPPTRELLMIERLQGWSMLVYYPLEHLYYLCSHGIIPSNVPHIKSLFSSHKLNPDRLALWSSRFWMLYVILQFAHLREDRKLLKMREKTLKKAKGTGPNAAEKEELRQRWDAFWNEVVVNVGYLPLTIHWSLKKGLFPNDVWVGLFGLAAALASFRSGWKATALPSASPTVDDPDNASTPTPLASVAIGDAATWIGYNVDGTS